MNKFTGFVNGLSGGLNLGGRLNAMRDQGDIDQIARANPEQSTGFTAEQGEELRRAAESGQYDIGWDEASKSYTVTPKSDQSMTSRITQQGVTDFLGHRTAGTMSDSQVANARQRAMARVVSRSDPAAGARMMREVTSGERDDQRYEWERARATREMRKGEEADANDAFMKSLDDEVGRFMRDRMIGGDGQTRPATPDDYLAASQYKAAKLIEGGKIDAAQAVIKDYNAQSFIKIQLETAQRDQALGQTIAAVNAGNLDAARQFYDRFLPDGATVTDVKQDGNGSIVVERQADGGQKMPPMTFKDVNHLTSSLASLKDPMAVYQWSQNEFRNTLALRQDARSERADKRAGSGSPSREERLRYTTLYGEAGRRMSEATKTMNTLLRDRDFMRKARKPDSVEAQQLAGLRAEIEGYRSERATYQQYLVDSAAGGIAKSSVAASYPGTANQEMEISRLPGGEVVTAPARSTGGATGQWSQPGGAGATTGRSIARGQVVNGYEFLGGDPRSQKSWRQVSSGRVN